jgi:hypothetical protein
MKANEITVSGNWSLWTVDRLGMLLLTEDGDNVLVQEVELENEVDLVAISRSPTQGRTRLLGEGGHPDTFETVLTNHLAVFEIDRESAERTSRNDPVLPQPTAFSPRM